MHLLINLMLTAITVYMLGQALEGVTVASFATALYVAISLRVCNAILRPTLFILTLPINVLTLGLFSFVIMGLMIWFIGRVVPGFSIDSFSWAMGFAVLLVFLNSILTLFSKKRYIG